MNDQRLKRAIRAFTVDAGTPEAPKPNGAAEAAFDRLSSELRNKVVPLLPNAMATRLCERAAAWCEADVKRLQELRQAAEEFFREDFRHPKELELGLSVLGRLEVWWTTAVVHRLERMGVLEPTCYCYYGSFPGGDPRDFRPDPENATAELAEHRVLCAAWSSGQQDRPDIGLGLGTVLCEHHRRVPRPPPQLLRARRRLLRWFRGEDGP